MNKIMVNVFVPTLDMNFDIELPINLEMEKVISKIQNAIYEISDKAYIQNPDVKLYDKFTGLLINTNNIVKYSGLTNGSSIMMI